MPSYYEINVSKNGHHIFATAPRSCVDEGDARMVLASISMRYPTNEGFLVTCTYYKCSGTTVNF